MKLQKLFKVQMKCIIRNRNVLCTPFFFEVRSSPFLTFPIYVVKDILKKFSHQYLFPCPLLYQNTHSLTHPPTTKSHRPITLTVVVFIFFLLFVTHCSQHSPNNNSVTSIVFVTGFIIPSTRRHRTCET